MTGKVPQPADIVLLSLEPWDEVWRRNQYLVAGLLRTRPRLRVLFVEPAADPLHRLISGGRPRRGQGLRAAPALSGVESGRLWLYQPTKWLPRRIDAHADRRSAQGVVRASRRLRMQRPTLWVNDPGGAAVLALTSWPSLYDITDDWLAANRPPREHERLVHDEARLFSQCEEVTVCSTGLAQSKGALRPVTLVTNAVDVARYRAPTSRPTDLPEGRVALYLGTLHRDRLDLDLCVETARTLAGVATLVFVGPVALDPKERDRLVSAGAALLGARPFTRVPGYLQHADVLVVPHVVDAFTDSLDPLKLYEYRAVGRPVVATPVAGFRASTDVLIDSVAAERFPAAVLQALASPAATSNAPPSADIPTWESQVALMAEVIDRAQHGTTHR